MSIKKTGEIVGTVTYREGDGVSMEIPKGPCEVELTRLDATITWVEGDSHGAATIPLGEYARYIAAGSLTVS
ncbi:hypothetical protein [Piscinibacter sakaiensis]|uniref:hypothetical protein n=1 Tax=Piscinibacter sakaiensis TaxID=1547922 RepID=UPI003AAF30E4